MKHYQKAGLAISGAALAVFFMGRCSVGEKNVPVEKIRYEQVQVVPPVEKITEHYSAKTIWEKGFDQPTRARLTGSEFKYLSTRQQKDLASHLIEKDAEDSLGKASDIAWDSISGLVEKYTGGKK